MECSGLWKSGLELECKGKAPWNPEALTTVLSPLQCVKQSLKGQSTCPACLDRDLPSEE